ncbi:TetR/AcrR family transcriptional regulator [Clostridioides sp. ZZV15-6388]|uniref:TetR/AcrR family transcriptional regulator n=1 Tax=unclassified Clostridioides TaxID=2635829 RepID=UPI001D10557B|nr:TetR/AcrR family transcriptional regulator [Clostridioides sp. ZZV15-6388]MCC0664880.1 TetR/AcrR family transcriptional regulator [Clostridioides sp. ZZV15-6597]
MGRRKKEPKSVHRENIASAAQILFMQKGIEATSMDDIAKKAGYSKATLYVYFKNKEEIVGVLVLESMKKLHTYITSALEKQTSTKTRYDFICNALLKYQEEFPFYFKIALDEINIDFENTDYLPEEKETFRVGEEINEKIKQLLKAGILSGELREDIEIMPTIFSLWGMLSGIIQTAANKEAYIKQEVKLSKQEFLKYGFDMLYSSISK